jgi:hypothetical protein
MERFLHHQNIWILLILALLAFVTLSMAYRLNVDMSLPTDIVTPDAMENVNCWRQDERTSRIYCLRGVPACPSSYNVGLPPPPLTCSY